MNINRKSFPFIEQIQKGKLDLNITPEQFLVFFPFFSFAEKIIRSKPKVDYLCKTQIGEVLKCGLEINLSQLNNAKGVLLFGDAQHKGWVIYNLDLDPDGCGILEFMVVGHNYPELFCKVKIGEDTPEIEYSTIYVQEKQQYQR